MSCVVGGEVKEAKELLWGSEVVDPSKVWGHGIVWADRGENVLDGVVPDPVGAEVDGERRLPSLFTVRTATGQWQPRQLNRARSLPSRS